MHAEFLDIGVNMVTLKEIKQRIADSGYELMDYGRIFKNEDASNIYAGIKHLYKSKETDKQIKEIEDSNKLRNEIIVKLTYGKDSDNLAEKFYECQCSVWELINKIKKEQDLTKCAIDQSEAIMNKVDDNLNKLPETIFYVSVDGGKTITRLSGN